MGNLNLDSDEAAVLLKLLRKELDSAKESVHREQARGNDLIADAIQGMMGGLYTLQTKLADAKKNAEITARHKAQGRG